MLPEELISKELIEDVERLRSHMLHIYQKKQVLDYTAPERNVSYRKPLSINGYDVFHFAYAGRLPLNKLNDRALLKHTREYLEWCTHSIYSPKTPGLPLEKARIFIRHFYKENQVTDLDNRNHKFIIDALRLAGITKGDSWQQVALDISGHEDRKDHVQVYVVSEQHKANFSAHLDQYLFSLIAASLPHAMFESETQTTPDTAPEEHPNEGFW